MSTFEKFRKQQVRISNHGVGWLLGAGAILVAVAMGLSASTMTEGITWSFRAVDPPLDTPAGPALPNLPLQLVLDDGSPDGDFGVGAATAEQFLWFNRFDSPTPLNYDLEEVWVLFSPGPNMAVDGAIQLAVYLDPDSDPTNGADLLATYDETIQALDGSTFSVYSLDPPVPVQGSGDLLIGVVSRFVENGVTGPTEPAAIDTSSAAGRSWVAIWSGIPPPDPELPPDLFIDQVDVFVAGNWMIRGFGSPRPVLEVPATSWAGLAVLAAILGLAGFLILRGRSRALL